MRIIYLALSFITTCLLISSYIYNLRFAEYAFTLHLYRNILRIFDFEDSRAI